MCTICDTEYPSILVEIGQQQTRPRNRGELELALGAKAVANADLVAKDEDWKPEHCFCALDPFRTMHNAGVKLDFEHPSEPKVALYFHA
jgi:hypothetical protein